MHYTQWEKDQALSRSMNCVYEDLSMLFALTEELTGVKFSVEATRQYVQDLALRLTHERTRLVSVGSDITLAQCEELMAVLTAIDDCRELDKMLAYAEEDKPLPFVTHELMFNEMMFRVYQQSQKLEHFVPGGNCFGKFLEDIGGQLTAMEEALGHHVESIIRSYWHGGDFEGIRRKIKHLQLARDLKVLLIRNARALSEGGHLDFGTPVSGRGEKMVW